MAIKTRYRIKNSKGSYDVIHFETSADQIITSNERQFISQEDKNAIKRYVHNQLASSSKWVIEHNLNRFPSVTIVDSAGTIVVGDVVYKDMNNIEISFSAAFSGTAYLN